MRRSVPAQDRLKCGRWIETDRWYRIEANVLEWLDAAKSILFSFCQESDHRQSPLARVYVGVSERPFPFDPIVHSLDCCVMTNTLATISLMSISTHMQANIGALCGRGSSATVHRFMIPLILVSFETAGIVVPQDVDCTWQSNDEDLLFSIYMCLYSRTNVKSDVNVHRGIDTHACARSYTYRRWRLRRMTGDREGERAWTRFIAHTRMPNDDRWPDEISPSICSDKWIEQMIDDMRTREFDCFHGSFSLSQQAQRRRKKGLGHSIQFLALTSASGRWYTFCLIKKEKTKKKRTTAWVMVTNRIFPLIKSARQSFVVVTSSLVCSSLHHRHALSLSYQLL